MNGVEAQPSSMTLLFFNGPGSVNVGQTFQVSVGVQYFFAGPTEMAVDLYENGGPLLTTVHLTVSGSGTQTLTLQVTAPWTPKTWQLNAHGVYLEGGAWKQSSPVNLSIFVSVVGPTTTAPPPPPPSTFDFSASASVYYQSVQAGQSASYLLSVNLISGSPQTVSLDVSGAPSGASGSFSPSSGQPTFSSSLVVTTASSTPLGTYSLVVNCRGVASFTRYR
jgi:LysM repeat protein